MANDANIFENANHRKSIFRSSSFVVFNVFFCFIASECPHVVFHSFFISNGDSDKQCLKMWHCIFALLLSVRLHAWTALWQPDIQNHDSNPTWRIKLKNVKDGNRKQEETSATYATRCYSQELAPHESHQRSAAVELPQDTPAKGIWKAQATMENMEKLERDPKLDCSDIWRTAQSLTEFKIQRWELTQTELNW